VGRRAVGRRAVGARAVGARAVGARAVGTRSAVVATNSHAWVQYTFSKPEFNKRKDINPSNNQNLKE